VQRLWEAGRRRDALALLYRATLSRLAEQDGLPLQRGATEGDCLRLARQAALEDRLDAGKADVAGTVTRLWLDGAYGGRWPDAAAVAAGCAAWRGQFERSREPAP
jgi:hypothetical protein